MKKSLIYSISIGILTFVIFFAITHEYWLSKWQNEYRSTPITLKFGKAHSNPLKMRNDTIPLTQPQIDEYIESKYRIRGFDIDIAVLIVGMVSLFMIVISILLYRELQRVEEVKARIDSVIDKTDERLQRALSKFEDQIKDEKIKFTDELNILKTSTNNDIIIVKTNLEHLQHQYKQIIDDFMGTVKNYTLDNQKLAKLVNDHNELLNFDKEREKYIDAAQFAVIQLLLESNVISEKTYNEIRDQIDIAALYGPTDESRIKSATNLRGSATDQKIINIMKEILKQNNLSADYKDALLGAIEDISKRLGDN